MEAAVQSGLEEGRVTLADVVEECILQYDLAVFDRGIDEDGDAFFDLKFSGRNGNELLTRIFAREDASQIVACTQLPIHVNNFHRDEVLMKIHELNASLAVGAFVIDRELRQVSFRSGLHWPTQDKCTVPVVALLLLHAVDVADGFLPDFLRIVSRKKMHG